MTFKQKCFIADAKDMSLNNFRIFDLFSLSPEWWWNQRWNFV